MSPIRIKSNCSKIERYILQRPVFPIRTKSSIPKTMVQYLSVKHVTPHLVSINNSLTLANRRTNKHTPLAPTHLQNGWSPLVARVALTSSTRE
ncbi:hypothetical protein TNCV_1309241 [Trichonephila clavipes]|nr:hypothetical protein TNCV_1309241 [Trichonephila clavipes]